MSKSEILEKLREKRTKCIVYTRVMGLQIKTKNILIAYQ